MVSCLCISVSLSLYLLFMVADASSSSAVAVNCGSTEALTVLRGREWVGDHVHPKSSLLSIKGLSVITSATEKQWDNTDVVPYRTARISHSQFIYSFQLNPGQKFIRLHFNPTLYHGYKRFKDLFTVEAGPFILLANFSASVTARAIGRNTFAKEFCITILENEPLNIIFSPAASQDKFYAFINGIEIISVPPGLSYCHSGDIGVQVVGQKSVIYIDNTSALELVHQKSIRWDLDDIHDMFRTWPTVLDENTNKIKNNITWKVTVDVGFSYLVRLHFFKLGFKLADTLHKNYMLTINRVNVSIDIIQDREDEGILWYKNYLVMVKGHNPVGRYDILISLCSKDGLVIGGHGLLERFEIFKLSNDANSLASPAPHFLPSSTESSMQILFSRRGSINAFAMVVFSMICLVNTIVYKLRQIWEVDFSEEENRLPIRAKQLCRRFSLPEIQAATDDFFDAFLIGRGGFGNVYKGFIDNGQQIVAIKRLKSNSTQGKREFWTEIETLTEVRHVNIVSLIGYCNEQKEMILVYEYLHSGTLADHLYKRSRKGKDCSPLSWKQRLEICIGAGRGLDYLHTGLGIIHCDIKVSNILLDENLVPKVSDFGLAKIERDLEKQHSTNLKGTFGYMDPDYHRTRRLTTKSDTYSFGVILLEVLCGRPAIIRWAAEDERSLTMWALDNINKGEVYQIVAPNLKDEISPESLTTFVRVAKGCLHDDPEERPTMAHVILNLDLALKEQEKGKSLSQYDIAGATGFIQSQWNDNTQKDNANCSVPTEAVIIADDKAQQDNVNSLVPNKRARINVALQCTDEVDKKNSKPLLHNMMTNVTNLLSCYNTALFSMSKKQVTSPLNEHRSSKIVWAIKVDGKKLYSVLIWPWDAIRKFARPSRKKKLDRLSVSEYIRLLESNDADNLSVPARISHGNILVGEVSEFIIFKFSELKAATRNFGGANLVGEGGFGRVYRGQIDKKLSGKLGCGSIVAVKRLTRTGFQGRQEWQSEVDFLGRLSHPNFIKLLGYCQEASELLLVYEFMPKGSLEAYLFNRRSGVLPLPWDTRLKILTGIARALAYLHALKPAAVIYRDVKSSNILLDESYHAKLSDFGLATLGPTDSCTHVSTKVIGTYGYAAPEYYATGHLYVKSDVYGFGIVLVEILTGLRTMDRKRPPGKANLAEWIQPYLNCKRKMKKFMDPSLNGRYSANCAFQIACIAQTCIEREPKNRPTMQEIVEKLENIGNQLSRHTWTGSGCLQ